MKIIKTHNVESLILFAKANDTRQSVTTYSSTALGVPVQHFVTRSLNNSILRCLFELLNRTTHSTSTFTSHVFLPTRHALSWPLRETAGETYEDEMEFISTSTAGHAQPLDQYSWFDLIGCRRSNPTVGIRKSLPAADTVKHNLLH